MLPILAMSIAAVLQAATADRSAVSSAVPAPARGPDVVVEGRTRDTLDERVENLTAINGAEAQVSRWADPICPQILGIRPEDAAYVVGRITGVATQIGVAVAPPGCSPNIVASFTNDADTYARTFAELHPTLYQETGSGIARLDRLKSSFLSPRPVRWMESSVTKGVDGQILRQGDAQLLHTATRLIEPTRQVASLRFMVIDGSKLHGITLTQIGDSLAMVTFAQPAMDATYDYGTVLSVFTERDAGRSGPDQMTGSDRSFLKALYSADPRQSAAHQRRSIEQQMTRGAHAPREAP